MPYCPRCGTPLSSHEVAQGYRTLKERSAIVRFKVKDEENTYFLAWTTTPWTLPSNIALCVNPEEIYCKVKATDGKNYILAKALLDSVLVPAASPAESGEGKGKKGKKGQQEEKADKEASAAPVPAYEILQTCTGKELEWKEYEPLYECAGEKAAKQGKKGHYVVCDDYVTMTDGTGIVHIAPAFGEDDARIGRKYDLPLIQFVDEKGCMTEETPFAGMRTKPSAAELKADPPAISADPEILKDLDKSGKLFSAPKFEHDYPHCWRCDTPLDRKSVV